MFASRLLNILSFSLFIAYLKFLDNFTGDAIMVYFPLHASVQPGNCGGIKKVPSGQQTHLPLLAIFLIAVH